MSKLPDFDPAKFRENAPAIAAYLNEAFNENDLGAVVTAINTVMRSAERDAVGGQYRIAPRPSLQDLRRQREPSAWPGYGVIRRHGRPIDRQAGVVQVKVAAAKTW